VKFASVLLATTATLVSVPATAQSSSSPATGLPAVPAGEASTSTANASTGPAAQEQLGAGEIVVTAQKRTESINKVGLTIQALSGDQLSQQGVKNVADLTKVIPSLTVANSTYNTPVYTLRGVGFYDNSLAAYPAVSVYTDEVPLPFPVMASQAGMDVERVEVLKGPQGTLFGENATGGAINYIAAKPTSTYKAGVDASYSRFGLFEGQAFVSGPISDTLKFRVALKGAQGGAWQESYTRDDKLGTSRLFAGRLLLDWDPTEKLKFELNVNGSVDKSDPQAGQYFALHPQLPVVPAGLTNAPFAPQTDRAADWNPDHRPRGDDRQYQFALRGTYDLTDDLTLTSITSYVHFTRDQVNDPDGLAAEQLEFNLKGKLHTFNQELRIANGNGDRFRWILGGNFESNKSEEFAQQFDGVSTVNATLAFPAHSNDLFLNTQTKSYAAFLNGDYDLTDKLTIKGGVRYTQTNRNAQTCTLDPGDDGGYVSSFFAGIASAVTGTTVAPPTSGGCITLNGQTFLPEEYVGKLHQHNVSWRAGLDYKVAPGILLYVNVAKGYKAGGYLFTNASNADQYNPVTQESVLDYEGGFKASLMGHKIQINGAGFHYDYRDKQTRSKLNDPVFGVLDALVNVPKSEMTGGELEVTFRPIKDWAINFAGTYVSSKVDRFVGVGFNGGTVNYAGSPLPFIPKWVLAAGSDYKFPVSGSLNAFLGFNATYNSSSYAILGTDADNKLKSYALLDLRAGVETADGKYRLTVFGKNVTNTYYYTNAPTIYDTQVRYTGRPATYGVTLSARY
jgi:iron complex outermembrane recepter protein